MLIGVTGTIGSGKTLVAGLLGDLLEVPVYNSDEICRQLLEKGEAGYAAFVKAWGNKFLDETGEIDRLLLRTAVFEDHSLRQQLESILHPLVRQILHEEQKSRDSGQILIAEVPLLFECGWHVDFDAIICVIADRNKVMERVAARDLVAHEDVEKILDVQMDPALKAQRSDWVVNNSGDIAETQKQVRTLADAIKDQIRRNSR